jgi:NAD+ kinase
MRIAIHGRNFQEKNKAAIQGLFDGLKAKNIHIQVSDEFHRFLHQAGIERIGSDTFAQRSELFEADFFLSVGGDGTLLEAITFVGEREIPILGINAGRLGFLAITSPEDIREAIHALHAGYYQYDERSLVHLESHIDVFEGLNFGLNEFTVTKRDSSSMIIIHTFIDGEYLNSYWADGLIISTPTGSTGYSLSCGGPVILPQSNNFVITPVSPHNLTVRPMVIPDNSIISLEVEGRSKNFMASLDSRSQVIEAGVQLAVSKEKFKARLVKLNNNNFLNTLRSKLNWGLDVRN